MGNEHEKFSQRLAHAMRMSVEQSAFDAERTLTQALSDAAVAAASELPRTGVPVDAERSLSSAFVHIPDRHYGTRSSTLLALCATEGTWQLRLSEWTHPTDQPTFTASSRRDFELNWGQISNT